MKKIIRTIIFIIFLLSIYGVLSVYNEEQADNEVYEDTEQYIDSTQTNNVDDIASYQSDYDWEKLNSINSDIVGWINIPGNDKINFPVVKGKNNEYYLNHDYTGKWNSNGAAFVDYKVDSLSLNKVIYGHNMNRSSTQPVFTTLMNYYKDEQYFKDHRTLYYTEENGMTKKYKVIGVCWFNLRKEKEYSYLDLFFETEEQFRGWVDYMKANSKFYDLGDTEIDYRADETISLSTCYRINGAGQNGRLVLFCVNLTNNELEGSN